MPCTYRLPTRYLAAALRSVYAPGEGAGQHRQAEGRRPTADKPRAYETAADATTGEEPRASSPRGGGARSARSAVSPALAPAALRVPAGLAKIAYNPGVAPHGRRRRLNRERER